jgi:hypothetical protein
VSSSTDFSGALVACLSKQLVVVCFSHGDGIFERLLDALTHAPSPAQGLGV